MIKAQSDPKAGIKAAPFCFLSTEEVVGKLKPETKKDSHMLTTRVSRELALRVHCEALRLGTSMRQVVLAALDNHIPKNIRVTTEPKRKGAARDDDRSLADA